MLSKFKPITFDEALPRLVAAYSKRKLVPFTGSGISAPNIPVWKGFLSNLCNNTGLQFNDKMETSQELVQFSEPIVTNLCRESKVKFVQSVKESLGYGKTKPLVTPQCENLSKIYWPMVLSTNYDTMFVDAHEAQRMHQHDNIKVFGRNSRDCHALLASLNASSQTCYWALQGYFGKNHNHEELANEIVVGYRQYRNATFNNLTFRSVFAEVFRNYSFLFMGTGLSEDYFRGLFGEVLEKFGSNPYPHCALFRRQDFEKGLVDHHFLHTKLNIIAIIYEDPNDDHTGLNETIKRLSEELVKERNILWKVSFNLKNLSALNNAAPPPGLEIISGTLPQPDDKECIIISAGYENGYPLLSKIGRAYIKEKYDEVYDQKKFIETGEALVRQYGNKNLYAAIARDIHKGASSYDSRDLRKVADAVEAVLKVANGKYGIINIMLLAAGKRRVFPPLFALIQMIRGYKAFLEENILKSTVRIYAVDPAVISYIRTKPLEIEELLNCKDMSLTIEIHDKEDVERYRLFIDSKKSLEDVSGFYSINKQFWKVEIMPAPFKDQKVEADAGQSLEDLGLIPGSTISYTRRSVL